MTYRAVLLLPVILLALLIPPSAVASSYRVGISDQDAAMFDNPNFTVLGIQRVRYLVPWNALSNAGTRAEIDTFMGIARDRGYEPFVTFTARRGCWSGSVYSRSSACRAPSVSRYRSAVRAFRKRYPSVKVFAAWNEANHKSQPTARSPRLAASYWNALRSVCRGCTLVAADLLDQSNLVAYLRSFRRYAKGSPKRWGLHNYSDVNRKRTKGTAAMLRNAPGEVWLTETGGLVRFEGFPYSESRAASRTKFMFSLADKFDSRRRGYRSKITRLYVYQWTGAPRGARFDAGLVNPDGTPRANYATFRSLVKTRLK